MQAAKTNCQNSTVLLRISFNLCLRSFNTRQRCVTEQCVLDSLYVMSPILRGDDSQKTQAPLAGLWVDAEEAGRRDHDRRFVSAHLSIWPQFPVSA